MDSRRNKHHFLARHLLAHFADTDGCLHVYDRDVAWSARRDIPERLAVEKHLYSPGVTDALGRDPNDDAVERWLASEIDTPAAEPIRRLVNGDPLVALSRDELHAIANFVALLDLRTPRVRDFMVANFSDGARAAIMDHKQTRKALQRRGIRTSMGEVRRTAKKYVETRLPEHEKPSWLNYLMQTRNMARVNVKARRWAMVRAPADTEFVTSDLGAVKALVSLLEPATWQPGTFMARAHWLIPLAPHCALALTPTLCPYDPEGTPQLMRAVNKQFFVDARRFAYSRTRIDVQSLIAS